MSSPQLLENMVNKNPRFQTAPYNPHVAQWTRLETRASELARDRLRHRYQQAIDHWHRTVGENGQQDHVVPWLLPSNSMDQEAVAHFPDVEARKPECAICYTEILDLHSNVPIKNCEHVLCKDCLNILVARCSQESAWPVKCCRRPLDILAYQMWLTPENLRRYREWLYKYGTPRGDRLSCSHCDTFMHDLREHSKPTRWTEPWHFQCYKCAGWTCGRCKNDAGKQEQDRDHRCKVDEDTGSANFGYSPDNRVKRCPGCKTPVWLAEACNHITCPECRDQWCFICLQPWVEIEAVRRPDGEPWHLSVCQRYCDPIYDEELYDVLGFHRDTGFDREGYNLSGLNAQGQNTYGGTEPAYNTSLQRSREALWGAFEAHGGNNVIPDFDADGIVEALDGPQPLQHLRDDREQEDPVFFDPHLPDLDTQLADPLARENDFVLDMEEDRPVFVDADVEMEDSDDSGETIRPEPQDEDMDGDDDSEEDEELIRPQQGRDGFADGDNFLPFENN